jgi:hypothetical protein
MVRARAWARPAVNRAQRSTPELTERLWPSDAVGLEVAGGLKAPYRSICQWAVPAVDRPR